MKKYYFLLFLFPYFSAFGHEYHFRVLPSSYNIDFQNINLLFQSSDKLMWLGTGIGLYSFDGRKYNYFPRPDELRQRVTVIAEGPNGQIWAGYEDGHILITNFQGKQQIIPVDSLQGASISKIVFLPNYDVAIATYGKGLWILHDHQLEHVAYENLAAIHDIYDAVLDTQGKIWLGTDDGIWIYTPGPSPSVEHINKENGLPDDIVTRLSINQQGDILVGMYDFSTAQYNKVRGEVESMIRFASEDGNIVGLAAGFHQDYFIATEKSIWVVAPGLKEHKITIPFPLKNRIESILYDESGNLWMSSGNRLYMANTQLEYLRPAVTGIQAILSMKDKLWYGCQNGLYSTDKEGFHLHSYFPGQSLNVISMYKSSDDLLWIGTFGQGLYIFDPAANKIKHLTEKDRLSNTSILHISGKDKTVWLATLGGVTQIEWSKDPFESNLRVNELHDQFETPPGYVYDAFVSSAGKVWFCTDGKGLFYLDKGALHAFPISYLESDSTMVDVKTIYSLTEDWEHRLWVSIPKGIVLCVDTTGKVVKKLISSNGALNSLVMTRAEELLLIREGTIQTVNANGQFYWLDETSGLASFTPNINATNIDDDGSVWIADTDILLHYTSYNLSRERFVRMQFEAISPGSLDQLQPVKLMPDSNFLDVRFTGIWYQDPAHVHYRYMLKGHDADWIYTQEGRAVYSRLSPGAYTFALQGSQDDDFSQSPTLERSFIVMPPIYLRWWFILAVALLAGWIVYSIIRARIKRLQKYHLLEKEKTTHQLHAIQAQVNPHFLFNSFNTLSSIIEEDQKAAVDYVDQLSSFFRGALMHRDDELITIAEEMDIVKNYMYILTKRYGDNIRMEEHITNLIGWIAPLSIQLLVENAIKHNTVSAGRKLSIRITIDNKWVEVSNPIQPKFQSNEESTGFGLSSLITRYTYLTPLKIEISKETNRFTVRIPVLYPDKDT